nr:MAG TPA: hypothetical protein [Caudoviricetes sp.]
MWEELLSVITDRYNPLESMQENVLGYVDPNQGWDLNIIDQWFTERGYDYVGDLDLFDENNQSDIYVEVDGIVWRSQSNAHDNSIYWYYESDSEGNTLDELRFLHGYAHMFIWDNDTKTCEIVNMAE